MWLSLNPKDVGGRDGKDLGWRAHDGMPHCQCESEVGTTPRKVFRLAELPSEPVEIVAEPVTAEGKAA